MPKDFLNQELRIGDEVIVAIGGNGYAPGLAKAVIERFTPQRIAVKYSNTNIWESNLKSPDKIYKI